MESPNLIRLAYVSCSQTDRDGIDGILSTAQRRNPGLHITGGLICTGQYFFQTLEGPEHDVDRMFARIRTDARHFGVTPLISQHVEARQFAAWTMGFVWRPVLDAFVTPLFAQVDQERADILSQMAVQALCQST